MPADFARIQKEASTLLSRFPRPPRIGLILGSGLGEVMEFFPSTRNISLEGISSIPPPTVSGHRGGLLCADLTGGRTLAAFMGRNHYYESGSYSDVLAPVHLASALGISTLIVTNAAGGLNPEFHPGDFMAISDHVRFNRHRLPAHGPAANRALTRYDEALLSLARAAALETGILLHQGVYCGVDGPSYETRAEIAMIRLMGCDAVGMSTIPEAELAAQLGMNVLGISLITNKAAGLSGKTLSHAEVTMQGNASARRLYLLLAAVLPKIFSL